MNANVIGNQPNSSQPTPKAGIMNIRPYQAGARSPAHTMTKAQTIYKLSANESACGTSPAAIRAFIQTQNELAHYPDSGALSLRQTIADTHHLSIDHIMTGNGSDDLLSLLAQTYLSPGDEAIITEYSFNIYKIQILAAGAKPITVKEKNYRIDPDAILAAITPQTRAIFIANPGNPSGTYLSAQEIYDLHSAIPAHILLILDGAYAEYVTAKDYHAGESLVACHKNVVMTRTLSKIYGLAGLRIGWMYAPTHIIDAVNRIRGPFNVNIAASYAAQAALQDNDFLQKSIQFNEQWREWLWTELTSLPVTVTPSVTNFLLIHFPETGPKNAIEANLFLQNKGYILRPVANYNLPFALRLTIGCETANRGLISALTNFFNE